MTTYAFTPLRAGRLLLDAGSMFGVIPRVVWSRTVDTDDKNRVELAHNCILLEGDNKKILIEVGTGDKLPDKMKSIFGLGDRTIVTALAEHSVKPEDIDAVFVSHLHFDHAGALTRLPRDGEQPTWTGDDNGGGGGSGVVPTFQNATIYVQKTEWEHALTNTALMTKTYYPDHILPVQDQVEPVTSPIPFPTGHIPRRDELPHAPVTNRMTEVMPGINVFLVPGHTWGQQAIAFTDQHNRTIVFTPDVMPTHYHVGAAYSLAYDVEPYTSMLTRHWFLKEAAEHDWVLFLDHEPGDPLFRVRANEHGWYDLVPEPLVPA